MKNLLAFSLSVLFFAEGAQAKSIDSSTITEKYRYEQINQIADYLGAKIENPNVKLLVCDESAKKSEQWLARSIHELIDQKRPEELKEFKADPKKFLSKVKDCSSRCSCNGYSLMLSDLSAEREKSEYKELDSLLTDETKKLTKEKSISCARKLKWFCKSKLRTYLKQQ